MVDAAVEKRCTKCGNSGPFNSNKKRKGSLSVWCSACESKRSSAWNKAHPEKARANREKYRKANPDKIRAFARQVSYGITTQEFKDMLNAQGGKCAICLDVIHPTVRSISAPNEKVACVDHDHATKRIRGLLCGPCNRALGQFRDDPNILRSAIQYLLKGAT